MKLKRSRGADHNETDSVSVFGEQVSAQPTEFRNAFQIETRVRKAVSEMPVAMVQTDQSGRVLWVEDHGWKLKNPNFAFAQGDSVQLFFGESWQRIEKQMQSKITFQDAMLIQSMQLIVLAQPQYNNDQLTGIVLLLTLLSYQKTLEEETNRPQSIQNGRLEDFGGLSALMQLLATSKPTGCLELDTAKLYFENGMVVAVEHPTLLGKEAVMAVSMRTTGKFYFHFALTTEPQFELSVRDLILGTWKKNNLTTKSGSKDQSDNLIILPNALAAHAFVAGVGGFEVFSAAFMFVPEVQADCIVLRGRGLRVVVLNAKESEFINTVFINTAS